ncbi:MAG: hypothetical protein WCT28_03230 [Patescibacteria group bacterium]|jgi:hypothetical protein
MPVPLFEIVGAELKSTDPVCLNIVDVLRRYGRVSAYVHAKSPVPRPDPGEEIVVVADAKFQLHYVREGVLVATIYGHGDPCDILLSRAINRDDGNKIQIVAISEREIADPSAWKIVSQDEWIQVGMERVLIRAFSSLDEARAQVVDDRLVIVSIDDEVERWRGIAVHGNALEYNPVGADNPLVVKKLGIPEGWAELEWKTREIGFVLDGELNPFEATTGVMVMRAVFTDAGVYLVAKKVDGRNGLMFFGREFTREEVRGKIWLQ